MRVLLVEDDPMIGEAIIETQRRFVADAAHELRSPLTALLLQAAGGSQTY